MKKFKYISLILLSSIYLTSCYSAQEIEKANSVINASASEVEKCQFVEDLQSVGQLQVDSARFNLKMQAARLNATHIVETEALPTLYDDNLIGVIILAKAYRCPQGASIESDNEESKLNFDFDKYQYLLYDPFFDRMHLRSRYFARPFHLHHDHFHDRVRW